MRDSAKVMAIIAGIGLLCLYGCGGHARRGPDGQIAADQIGDVEVTVTWPPRPQSAPQVVPNASNAIQLTVLESLEPPLPLAQTEVVRPDSPPWTTSTTIAHVPASDQPVVLLAQAFPDQDCSGVVQAEASLEIIVPPCDYAYPATGSLGDDIVLTLVSTITQVEVTPNPASVNVGETVQLTATAKNDDGHTVLVPVGRGFTWEVIDGTAFASVDENGLVRGLSEGTAIVRATETEAEEGSRKSGTAEVTVGDDHGEPYEKWRFELPRPPWSATGDLSPSIGPDGTVYVGCDDGNLYAIGPDGTEKWRFDTGENSSVDSSAVIGDDGTVYVISTGWAQESTLVAINANGTEKWRLSPDYAELLTNPAIGADGTLYLGSFDGNLYAVNPDGTKRWRFQTDSGGSWYSAAIGVDGTIYVHTEAYMDDSGAHPAKLYSINPDGTEKWRLVCDGLVNSPAIGGDGTVYVSSDGLYAINPDGSLRWCYGADICMQGSPAIAADGTVYVGSYGHNLYAINSDGTQKWHFTTGDEIWATAAIDADGTAYLSCSNAYNPNLDATIYAICRDGTEKWRFTINSSVEISSATIADGTIYVSASYDYEGAGGWGCVLAIGVTDETPQLADAPWPMLHHDPRHTGRFGAPLLP